jgi:hypothetical protein
VRDTAEGYAVYGSFEQDGEEFSIQPRNVFNVRKARFVGRAARHLKHHESSDFKMAVYSLENLRKVLLGNGAVKDSMHRLASDTPASSQVTPSFSFLPPRPPFFFLEVF